MHPYLGTWASNMYSINVLIELEQDIESSVHIMIR